MYVFEFVFPSVFAIGGNGDPALCWRALLQSATVQLRLTLQDFPRNPTKIPDTVLERKKRNTTQKIWLFVGKFLPSEQDKCGGTQLVVCHVDKTKNILLFKNKTQHHQQGSAKNIQSLEFLVKVESKSNVLYLKVTVYQWSLISLAGKSDMKKVNSEVKVKLIGKSESETHWHVSLFSTLTHIRERMKSFASSLMSSQYGESNSNSPGKGPFPQTPLKQFKTTLKTNLWGSEQRGLHHSHRRRVGSRRGGCRRSLRYSRHQLLSHKASVPAPAGKNVSIIKCI